MPTLDSCDYPEQWERLSNIVFCTLCPSYNTEQLIIAVYYDINNCLKFQYTNSESVKSTIRLPRDIAKLNEMWLDVDIYLKFGWQTTSKGTKYRDVHKNRIRLPCQQKLLIWFWALASVGSCFVICPNLTAFPLNSFLDQSVIVDKCHLLLHDWLINDTSKHSVNNFEVKMRVEITIF